MATPYASSPGGTGENPNRSRVAIKVEVVVIGAGQAGLSSAYNLRQLGLVADRDFVVLDRSPGAGGAWQYRWPSLTLGTVNGIHDLPGMKFTDAVTTAGEAVQASTAVPQYFAVYEKAFNLHVHRPLTVRLVRQISDRFRVETDRISFAARGIINATGTWDAPFVPDYPGQHLFRGRQLHTHDYRTAGEFAGKHVVIVGAGISAVQLLDEISHVTTTTWVTRREPDFREGEFTPEHGHEAVAMVEERVRQGLSPLSVVSVTGQHWTPALRAAQARGVLNRHPMFSEITENGIRWADGTEQRADVILWCTGFRSVLEHLSPLQLREPNGGIMMTGRLATQVAKNPRVHLVGYGPSASTVGANRAGAAAAKELVEAIRFHSSGHLTSPTA
jgi:cation diffusion facilitator CzcD-associated flavoprotein CzcO